VQTLSRHITAISEDRALLRKLRETCIRERLNYTWTAAGRKLLNAYQVAIDRCAAARNNRAVGEMSPIAT
jgi:hypothetical protein